MKKARKAALFYSAPWYRAIHVANEIEYQIDDYSILSSIPEKMDGLLDQPKTIRENRSKTIEEAIADEIGWSGGWAYKQFKEYGDG